MTKEIIDLKIRAVLGNHSILPMNMEHQDGPVVSTTVAYLDRKPTKANMNGLDEDIALSLGLAGVRVSLKGLALVIEVPNEKSERSYPQFRDAIASFDYAEGKSLPLFLGYDTAGSPMTLDLAVCPHVLVSGAVRQGQGILQKTIINSLLRTKKPGEIKFLLVDSKIVEMTDYRGLDESWFFGEGLICMASDVKEHLNALCKEMEDRYQILYKCGCNSATEYRKEHSGMPYIVVIVNDYADYFGHSTDEKNAFLLPIIRIAQKGRSVGIHCIISTQRPDAEHVSGIIKANFPVRIATRCPDKVTSRMILDCEGAESLIGRGDMLLADGLDLVRFQGLFTDEDDTRNAIAKANSFLAEARPLTGKKDRFEPIALKDLEDDAFKAARLIVEIGDASTSTVQRRLGWGYAKASRIMDQLERAGIIGPVSAANPREILVKDLNTLEEILKVNIN